MAGCLLMSRYLTITALLLLAACGPSMAEPKLGPAASIGKVAVEHSVFVLTTADGARLTSRDLVGSTFEMQIGPNRMAQVRIDGVTPAAERPQVLLHHFSIIDSKTGKARSLCDADAYGRRAGFPVRGTFRDDGSYVPAGNNSDAWLLSCTSGSQAKCVLWGYDPDGRAADGRSLAQWYQACQHVVRADYDGKGVPHTKNGTEVDVWDDAGVQTSAHDPASTFEAGWGPDGAVCVARTRWPDLLSIEDLHKANPQLAGECTPETAKARGALIYTRVCSPTRDIVSLSPPMAAMPRSALTKSTRTWC